jgi:hypothetical protein
MGHELRGGIAIYFLPDGRRRDGQRWMAGRSRCDNPPNLDQEI